jgi:uncharacterized membrane protein YcaP (DUF421 family)
MDLVLRAVFLFAFVFFVMRILGRRELGSMEPFDLILLIVLGDAIQQGLSQDDYSVTGAVLLVSTIGLIQVAIAFGSFKLRPLRHISEGDPIVLIENGRVIERNLKRERIQVDELAEQARLNQIGSLEDVAWAVLESSGQVSFVTKS